MRRPPFLLAIFAICLSLTQVPDFRNPIDGTRTFESANDARDWVSSEFFGTELTVSPGHHPGFDDAGLRYFARLAYLLQPSLVTTPASEDIPWLMKFGQPALAALSFLLFYWILTIFAGQWIALPIFLLILCSEALLLSAYSLNVYIFPFYAFILVTGFTLYSTTRKTGTKLSAFVAAILFSFNLVRSPSWVAIFPTALTAWRPNFLLKLDRPETESAVKSTSKKLIFFLFIFLMINSSINKHGHPVWHALHAGLMEFGGHVDSKKRIYPYFVPASDIPTNSIKRSSWSDSTTYQFVEMQNPNVTAFSKEYGSILKRDYLRIAYTYPLGMLRLFARRLGNLLYPDIWFWKPDKHTGTERAQENLALTVASILFVLAALVFDKNRLRFLLIFSLPLILPALLVYSSMPVVFIFWKSVWVSIVLISISTTFKLALQRLIQTTSRPSLP
jgi:hypothetical protein